MLSLCRISAGSISCPFVETVVFTLSKITSYIAKVKPNPPGCSPSYIYNLLSQCERFGLNIEASRVEIDKVVTTVRAWRDHFHVCGVSAKDIEYIARAFLPECFSSKSRWKAKVRNVSCANMKIRVGVTDKDWYEHLIRLAPEEVNFWQPSGSRTFRVLQPGEPFLFKLHSPENFIGQPQVGSNMTAANHLPSPAVSAARIAGMQGSVKSSASKVRERRDTPAKRSKKGVRGR